MSSTQVYDIDEGLWGLYVSSCQQENATPRIKDFLIWCDEQDYDRPDVYDGDWGTRYEN